MKIRFYSILRNMKITLSESLIFLAEKNHLVYFYKLNMSIMWMTIIPKMEGLDEIWETLNVS